MSTGSAVGNYLSSSEKHRCSSTAYLLSFRIFIMISLSGPRKAFTFLLDIPRRGVPVWRSKYTSKSLPATTLPWQQSELGSNPMYKFIGNNFNFG